MFSVSSVAVDSDNIESLNADVGPSAEEAMIESENLRAAITELFAHYDQEVVVQYVANETGMDTNDVRNLLTN